MACLAAFQSPTRQMVRLSEAQRMHPQVEKCTEGNKSSRDLPAPVLHVRHRALGSLLRIAQLLLAISVANPLRRVSRGRLMDILRHLGHKRLFANGTELLSSDTWVAQSEGLNTGTLGKDLGVGVFDDPHAAAALPGAWTGTS
eukprot:CAMPEP_0203963480 /NCGR_PEP_ID=MMETSP0359-20131031/93419_1 /ASSEMBLY_ACC=CAM_ASM_000338 /TAXON_ID=268821 /ORGANISM="Scrippsiella Hangoei, Strain SHTV-5" /LENGTH=142 /DNA_ID=CAMNT_0050899331 /DNA_START=135 /DNA_END=565 /DNA_ORIENTATION=-